MQHIQGMDALIDFSLERLAPLAAQVRVGGAEEGTGDAAQHFSRQILLAGETWTPNGSLSLRSEAHEAGVELVIREVRPASDSLVHVVEAWVTCGSGTFLPPLRWRLAGRLAASPEGAALPSTEFRVSGHQEEGHLLVDYGGRPRTVQLPAPCYVDWTLFRAVRALEGASFPGETFTLLRGLDTPLPGHHLGYAGSASVLFGEGVRHLEVYVLSGPGSLLRTFWVDAYRRVLLVLSGQEAYVWSGQGAVA